MVKVVIGSVVLCHLLMPAKNPQEVTQQNEKPGITKILGEVLDFRTGSRYLENKEKKEALRADTNIIIVKAKNIEGVYEIDSRACMLVRDETSVEKENRLYPKTKITEEVPVVEEKTEEVKDNEVKQEENVNQEKNSADIEVQDRPAVEDIAPEQKLPKLTEKEIKAIQEVKPVEPVKEEKKVEEKKVEKVEPKAEEPKKMEEKSAEPKKSLLDYIK